MRHFILLSLTVASAVMNAQQQQQLQQEPQSGNVFLTNNMNPVSQIAQMNIGNFRTNNDNNIGNQNEFLDIYNEPVNDIQEQSYKNIRQSSGDPGIDPGLSFNSSSRSSSSSASSYSSKSHKHRFSKKFKKFERNFHGKMVSHKKNKHLVDVCFNWR